MVKTAEQDGRAFSQRSESVIQFLADLRFGSKNGILDFAFNVSMAEFFWVDFRCIRRQELNVNFGMFGKVFLHQLAAMGLRAIPNEDKGSPDLATKMFQTLDQFDGIDRTFKMLLVDLS